MIREAIGGFSEASIEKAGRLSRRSFLRIGMYLGASLLLPRLSFACPEDFGPNERKISLYNFHTDELVSKVFWAEGQYLPGALDEINYILRDHRTGEVAQMDTGLLELLYTLKDHLAVDEPFHVVSAYRSHSTNEYLRRRNRRVAKNSMHLYGKAVDIRIPGCKITALRDAALELQRGGVGYYRRSNFVHVDVGPLRQWRR
ncbi:MAG: YcbK family protein [Thermodesulfovibrionales bacterium]